MTAGRAASSNFPPSELETKSIPAVEGDAYSRRLVELIATIDALFREKSAADDKV